MYVLYNNGIIIGGPEPAYTPHSLRIFHDVGDHVIASGGAVDRAMALIVLELSNVADDAIQYFASLMVSMLRFLVETIQLYKFRITRSLEIGQK